MVRYAGVEGGGTTFVAAIAEGDPTNIVERMEVPTTTPEETLTVIAKWLEARSFDALGIGTFGPVDVHKDSPTYGRITETPKPGWRNAKVVEILTNNLNVPYAFDTDAVDHARKKPRVGIVMEGQCCHGLLHPEAGHISVPRCPNDSYEGFRPALNCPDWLEAEAMCNSGALAKRAGLTATTGLADLPDDHEVWEVAAHYLAALCANLVLTVSPNRIVLSGGVMKRLSLFPKIRRKMVKMLNGYIPLINEKMVDQLIVPSRWGNNAGIMGVLTLASDAYIEANGGARQAQDAKRLLSALAIFAAGCAVGVALCRR